MVQSNVCDEAFKRMKQSLERGDVEKFDEKWSKMFGIRQAYWKHPRGSKFAQRYGFPKEGYEAVVKKMFRKKPMYTQDGMYLRLLAPFDDGTIVEGVDVEELIFFNFVTGPELGIQMPSLTHLHESAKEPTMGQTYVEENKEMRFRMNWGCHLTPWPNHLRDWNRTVAMVITTPPPKWSGHYKERWVFDTGATAHIMNNNRYMYNLCPMKQTITVANGTSISSTEQR
jgi:hypothetical protein